MSEEQAQIVTSMDALRKELETFNRHKLTALIREMGIDTPKEKRPRKKGPEHGKVISYTSVTKEYTCLLCGYKFSRTYQLTKGEQTTCFDPEGKVHIITLQGKEGEITIPCSLSKCSYCASTIKAWEREKLEQTLLMLIESITMKEAAIFSAIKKGKDIENARDNRKKD